MKLCFRASVLQLFDGWLRLERQRFEERLRDVRRMPEDDFEGGRSADRSLRVSRRERFVSELSNYYVVGAFQKNSIDLRKCQWSATCIEESSTRMASVAAGITRFAIGT